MAMYGILWQFDALPGSAQYLEQLLDAQVPSVLAGSPGFISARTDRFGERIVLSLCAFENEPSAHEGARRIQALADHFADVASGPPVVLIGKIHDRLGPARPRLGEGHTHLAQPDRPLSMSET